MKHTAGPWVICEQYVIQKRSDKCICQWGNYTKEEDARLIAAAPELLAALESTRGQWIHSVNAKQCLAAIAKATGETK